MHFWEDRKESPFVSLNGFTISVNGEESSEIYLLNKNGEKRLLTNWIDKSVGLIQLPKMSLENAENWFLVISKPPSQVLVMPNLTIALPSKKVRYRDLFAVLTDYNNRKAEIDPRPNWLQQDYYRLYFTFTNPSDVEFVVNGEKESVFRRKEVKTLILKLNKQYYEANAWIIFSELPDGIIALD